MTRENLNTIYIPSPPRGSFKGGKPRAPIVQHDRKRTRIEGFDKRALSQPIFGAAK